mgnify:CR=1 FL=1
MPPVISVMCGRYEEKTLTIGQCRSFLATLGEAIEAACLVRLLVAETVNGQIEKNPDLDKLDLDALSFEAKMDGIFSGFSSLESKVGEVLAGMGYPSVLEQEKRDRHAKLRQANMLVRDLEAQLGAGFKSSHIPHVMDRADKAFDAWWKTVGFSYVRYVAASKNSMKVELSVLCPEVDDLEEEAKRKKISARVLWVEKMAKLGFLVSDDGANDVRDMKLLAGNSTTAALTALFDAVFMPENYAFTYTVENREGRQPGIRMDIIRDISLTVFFWKNINWLDGFLETFAPEKNAPADAALPDTPENPQEDVQGEG